MNAEEYSGESFVLDKAKSANGFTEHRRRKRKEQDT